MKDTQHLIDQFDEEFNQLEYTFHSPYIKLNPFAKNPLSAYIRFKTPQMRSVQVIVKGKHGGEDLVYSPTLLSTDHQLCVPGLYPGISNQIEIKACTNDDICETTNITVPTSKLPNRPNLHLFYNILKHKTNESFMTFFLRDMALAYDENANVRWMLDTTKFVYPFEDYFALEESEAGLMLYSPCGQLSNILTFPSDFKSFAHAVARGKNKSFLVVGSKKGTTFALQGEKLGTAYDHILEISNAGKILRYLDLGSLLPMNDFRMVKSLNPVLDALHLNHVTFMPDDESLVISAKHLGFFKIDNETTQLKWIAGAHPTTKLLNRHGARLNLPYLTAVDEKGMPYPQDVQNGTNKNHLFDWPIIAHDGKPSGSFYTVFSNNGPVYDRNLSTRKTSSVLIYRIDEDILNIQEAARIILPEFAPIASNATYDEKTGIVQIFVSDIEDKNVTDQVYNKIYHLRLPPLMKNQKVQIYDVSGQACEANEQCLKPEILYEAMIAGRTYFYQARLHDLSKMSLKVNKN